MRKLAAKRLTASDLTLFEWHFRNRPAGNQKAINLNAEIFIDRLYPALPEIAQERGGKLPLDLSIYGPGLFGLDNRQRKIMKLGSYKNWRLDGEFVTEKPDEPSRYSVLAPGDIAVFEFFGVTVPSAAKMVLLARGAKTDVGLIGFFESILGARSMVQLNDRHLDHAVQSVSSLPDGHPIRELEIAAVEDAALGGFQGAERLGRRPSEQHISQEELLRARRNMEDIGRLGEELLSQHFDELVASGQLGSYEWISAINAVAPYDFRATESSGEISCSDVKTTSGEFERPLHISLSELRQMRDGGFRYDIHRIYDFSPNGARLRIARDLRDFASTALSSLENLPRGIQVDSVSVLPSLLPFGEETTLRWRNSPAGQ
jgi:hypothetical protein